jgi:hypothetical protein
MTFAELVIKFSATGDGQTKNQIRAIEVELKNVSNASVNAANKISQSFQKISSSRGLLFLESFGQNVSNQFTQAAASSVPFGNNILDLVQSFALLTLSAENVQKGIVKITASSIAKMISPVNALASGFANASNKLATYLQYDTEFGKMDPGDMNKFQYKIFSSVQGLEDLSDKTKKLSDNLKTFISGVGVEGSAIENFAAKLTVLGSRFLSITGFIAGVVAAMAILTAATVAMNLAIAKSTVQAAFNFEQLQARLSALKGPAKANDILEFVRRLAEPSNFTTEQLSNSAVQLEAFGLNAKRILPIIAQLGMAFGADEEKLRLLTDMFGRLSQGQLPDVQVMAQFGLSKSKLMKEGIKFDAQGSLLSSTREVMVAMEKIINRDYGKIFEQMANTGNAKLASLTDVFERLKIQVGNQLADTAKVAISSFANILGALERSGVLEQAAKTMLYPFEALGKVLGLNGGTGVFSNAQMAMASFTGALIAGFEELNIQTSLFVTQLGRIFELLVNPQGLTGMAYLDNVGKLIKDIGKGISGQIAPSRMANRGTDIAMALLGELQNAPTTDISKLLDESKKTDFGKLEDLLKNDKLKQVKTLEKIEQNTKTQNELTLRNMTYGGGELAAQGISAVQMGGFRSVSSPQINASNDIVRGVEKIVRGYSNSNNLNFSFRRS